MLINRIEIFKQNTFYSKTGKLRGKILEVGFGKGDSLQKYTSADLICAAELSKSKVFSAAAGIRMENRAKKITITCSSAMNLPFGDNTFDAVITMFAVCSFADPGQALSEIRRVLIPGGRYLALEHTVSADRGIRLVQNILSKPVHYFTGCNLKSDPVQQLTNNSFRIISTQYIPFFYEPTLMIDAVPI